LNLLVIHGMVSFICKNRLNLSSAQQRTDKTHKKEKTIVRNQRQDRKDCRLPFHLYNRSRGLFYVNFINKNPNGFNIKLKNDLTISFDSFCSSYAILKD
ncbi:MAG: hypothetical protein K2G90_06570, partial [Muribaculaceae bacterium]|nr:hypothetical protein [Muribaculaceae bacterium]